MTSENEKERRVVVAVLYATKGGMGDVGKFAATIALEAPERYDLRAIALSLEASEGDDIGADVDVSDEHTQLYMKRVLECADIVKIDIGSESAEQLLSEALSGVEAVISCLGNRQPSMARWCSFGTEKLIRAMYAQNVHRLVCLSSFGIGDDFMRRCTPITCLWACLLRTCLSSARRDLMALESVVNESSLDFVLVRSVGLTPSEPPCRSWHILRSPRDGDLKISIAKADVAAFMLQEAVQPSIHKDAVTIGHRK